MTTSSDIKILVRIIRENPDLGPALKFRLWLNDEILSEHELEDQLEISNVVQLDKGRHDLFIQHYDRHPSNTKVNEDGSVAESSMARMDSIKIHNIPFYASRGVNINKFLPEYDESFMEWAKKHRPGSNFPEELPAHPVIGQNGKLKIHFIWPLEHHGLYYGNSYDPCQPFIFGNNREIEVIQGEGDTSSPLKLFIHSDCTASMHMNMKLTKRNIKFHQINVDKDQKWADWFYKRHKNAPQLYKNGKWLCDFNHLPFVTVDDLLD